MSATLYDTSNSVFMEHCHSTNHVWADKIVVLPSSTSTMLLYTYSSGNMNYAEWCAIYNESVL